MTPTKELLEQIAAEEAELVLDRFDEEDAWRLGSLLVEEGRRRRAPIAVDVRRPAQVLFHAALPGAQSDNDEWVRRKSAVVFRFGKSSFAVGIALALANQKIEERYYVSSLDYSPHGGAVPIRVKNVGIVACAIVSGLPQEEDHATVVACLRKLKNASV